MDVMEFLEILLLAKDVEIIISLRPERRMSEDLVLSTPLGDTLFQHLNMEPD
jgi:hypothetical protein